MSWFKRTFTYYHYRQGFNLSIDISKLSEDSIVTLLKKETK